MGLLAIFLLLFLLCRLGHLRVLSIGQMLRLLAFTSLRRLLVKGQVATGAIHKMVARLVGAGVGAGVSAGVRVACLARLVVRVMDH